MNLISGQNIGIKKITKTKKLITNMAIAALNACPSAFYANINKLLRILATLPSSTAEPERVFSSDENPISSTFNHDKRIALKPAYSFRCIVIFYHILLM